MLPSRSCGTSIRVHENPSGIDGGPLGFLTWSLPTCAGLWAGEEFINYKKQLINAPSTPYSEVRWYSRWLMLACSWMLIGWLLSCLSRSYDVEVLPTQSTTDSNNTPQRLANSPVVLGAQVFAQGTHRRWAEPPFVPPPPWQERTWNYWMMSQKAGTLSYLIFAAGFSLALFVAWDWLVVRYSIEIPFLRSFGRNALVCYALHGFLIDAIGNWVPRDASPWLVIASLTGLFFTLFALAWALERKRLFIRL